MPENQKIKMVGYTSMAKCKTLRGLVAKGLNSFIRICIFYSKIPEIFSVHILQYTIAQQVEEAWPNFGPEVWVFRITVGVKVPQKNEDCASLCMGIKKHHLADRNMTKMKST